MPQTQREPFPYRDNVRTVQIVQDPPKNEKVINITTEAQEIQNASTIPAGSAMRRLIFIWLRVYVLETKYGKSQRVNVKIPIPIPIIGAFFARQLSFQKAAKLANAARRGEDITDILDSTMGFEFVRVEENNPDRNKSQLVVVGLD